MRVKKPIRSILIALILVFALSTTAFAAIPNNTIIFNDKAYDVSLLDDPAMVGEILAAFIANGNNYIYKDLSGNFMKDDGSAVAADTLPAITYKDANKAVTKYAEKDGDPVVVEETYTVTFEKGVAPVGQTTMYVKLVGVANQSEYTVFYNGTAMTYSAPKDAFRAFVPETLTAADAIAKLTHQAPQPPVEISYTITFEKGVAPVGQTTMYVKLVGVDNQTDYNVLYDGTAMTYSAPKDAFRVFVPESTTEASALDKLTSVKK